MFLSRAALLLGAAAAAVTAAANPSAAVWPIPQSMTTGNTTLLISQTIAVTYNGAPIVYTYAYEPADVDDSRQVVQGAVSRALAAIFQTGLVPWKLRPKNQLARYEPALDGGRAYGWVTSLAITTTSTAPTTQANTTTADEAYNLTVSADGAAKLAATTPTGVLRGLETLVQLFYEHSDGGAWYTPWAPVAVQDGPRYAHRGVLLDVARNWYEPEHLYRTVDALAWNKMNRLHLHATDSQSWPLEVPSMPEVAAQGAYGPGRVYGAGELAALQQYAAARGVAVVVEIDMPGHIGSLAWSHPELVVAYDAFPYFWWCAEPPCGALRLNSSAVDAFVAALLADVLPRVAPFGAGLFHLGGDELNANDSRLDPGVGTNATAVLQPLLQAFVDATHAQVRAHGLAPMVWEEIPLAWNATLGADTVVQTWLGAASVQAAVRRGLRVVDSDYNFWYLDCGRGQWLNFDNGAAYAAYAPFGDWCAPYKNWRLVYAHDPADGLTAAEAALVLGGEVALWSETADGANLDGLLWPRASAAGEVLWSGNRDAATGANRSQLTVAPRLNEWRERMLRRGVAAAPVQMVWCSQADNATECSAPVGVGY